MQTQALPLQSRDGHTFELRLTRPQAPRAGLMFIPALGVPARKYDGFAQALAAEGFAVAMHEWRGIGTSALRAARGRDWGYAELLGQDIPASVAALDPSLRWCFGGHSLGGQFAAMAAALAPAACAGLVLAATGVPDRLTFSGYKRWGISAFARLLPPLTRAVGHYPGERLGFAGREAGGVMRDWAATVLGGRYLDYGQGEPLDAALARLQRPALAIHFEHDWFVPEASLQGLLGKLGPAPHEVVRFDAARLGALADHFKWMRAAAPVAGAVSDWWGRLNP
ncbi:alpha/beta fold hydrolase [Arenimonas sp.]|uniref:alpha/beta hydrolase family protein n=1 Tax=Arenimonas sp. TaxID=1872635 RepID=UPI0025E4D616|nr:alpha/beta fold hydrolase [Arenimonas sp.]